MNIYLKRTILFIFIIIIINLFVVNIFAGSCSINGGGNNQLMCIVGGNDCVLNTPSTSFSINEEIKFIDSNCFGLNLVIPSDITFTLIDNNLEISDNIKNIILENNVNVIFNKENSLFLPSIFIKSGVVLKDGSNLTIDLEEHTYDLSSLKRYFENNETLNITDSVFDTNIIIYPEATLDIKLGGAKLDICSLIDNNSEHFPLISCPDLNYSSTQPFFGNFNDYNYFTVINENENEKYDLNRYVDSILAGPLLCNYYYMYLDLRDNSLKFNGKVNNQGSILINAQPSNFNFETKGFDVEEGDISSTENEEYNTSIIFKNILGKLPEIINNNNNALFIRTCEDVILPNNYNYNISKLYYYAPNELGNYSGDIEYNTNNMCGVQDYIGGESGDFIPFDSHKTIYPNLFGFIKKADGEYVGDMVNNLSNRKLYNISQDINIIENMSLKEYNYANKNFFLLYTPDNGASSYFLNRYSVNSVLEYDDKNIDLIYPFSLYK